MANSIIRDNYKYQVGTATVNKDFGSSVVHVYKEGNVVYVDIRTYNASTSQQCSATEAIFTLPEGFRPRNTISMPASCPTGSFSNAINAICNITPEGHVRVSGSGSYYQVWVIGAFPVPND